jgi:hypothetical protein
MRARASAETGAASQAEAVRSAEAVRRALEAELAAHKAELAKQVRYVGSLCVRGSRFFKWYIRFRLVDCADA